VLSAAAWGLAGLTPGARAYAQSAYPSRVVRIVVANPPGGDDDTLSRVISEVMAADLGQAVIVENRGGAATTVGAMAVAQSAPDGYTIGMGQAAWMSFAYVGFERVFGTSGNLTRVLHGLSGLMVGAVVYVGLVYALRVNEARDLVRRIVDRWTPIRAES